MRGLQTQSIDHHGNEDGEYHGDDIVGREQEPYPVCTLIVGTTGGVGGVEVIGGYGGRGRCPHGK